MRRACSIPERCFRPCTAAPNSAACMCMPASWPFPTFRDSRLEGSPYPGPPSVCVSDQRVLHAFAFGQQRQCLAGDVGFEVRALLMRLEGGLVAEQLVEQELRR